MKFPGLFDRIALVAHSPRQPTVAALAGLTMMTEAAIIAPATAVVFLKNPRMSIPPQLNVSCMARSSNIDAQYGK